MRVSAHLGRSGGGAGSGVRPLLSPCLGLLSSVLELEGGLLGRRLAGPLDSDLTTCFCQVGRPERKEQVRPRPSGAQAWSHVSSGDQVTDGNALT